MKDVFVLIEIVSSVGCKRPSGFTIRTMMFDTPEGVMDSHPHMCEDDQGNPCMYDIGMFCISDEEYILWKLTGEFPSYSFGERFWYCEKVGDE